MRLRRTAPPSEIRHHPPCCAPSWICGVLRREQQPGAPPFAAPATANTAARRAPGRRTATPRAPSEPARAAALQVGILAFGPTAAGAQLEGSKAFMKDILHKSDPLRRATETNTSTDNEHKDGKRTPCEAATSKPQKRTQASCHRNEHKHHRTKETNTSMEREHECETNTSKPTDTGVPSSPPSRTPRHPPLPPRRRHAGHRRKRRRGESRDAMHGHAKMDAATAAVASCAFAVRHVA